MTLSDLEHFKDLLVEREENLLDWLDKPNSAGANDLRKAQALLTQIREALGRVDSQSFGECDVCKGDIELYRLEVQPVTAVCLGCISDKERAQLEEELFLASKIHRALLPQTIEKIDGFDVAVRSLAARIVGGDYYDFLPPGNSGFSRVIVADTMGKGIPAGLLMSNIQGALRILAEDLDSPHQLISRLNKWLCRNVPVTKFISLICVGLGADGSGLIYTNAGHCPAILLRKKNNEILRLEPTGGVLGVHEGFEYGENKLELGAGDLLLLYTDGVIEAENGNGEMYGEDRLLKHIRGNGDGNLDSLIDSIADDVRSFTARSEFEDDFTIMALRKI